MNKIGNLGDHTTLKHTQLDPTRMSEVSSTVSTLFFSIVDENHITDTAADNTHNNSSGSSNSNGDNNSHHHLVTILSRTTDNIYLSSPTSSSISSLSSSHLCPSSWKQDVAQISSLTSSCRF